MNPYDLLNKLYNFYMTAIVSIVSRCGLTIVCIVEVNLMRISYGYHCISVTFTVTVIYNSCT